MNFSEKVYNWLQKQVPLRTLPSFILSAVCINIFVTLVLVTIVDSFIAPLPTLLTTSDVLWWMPLFLLADACIEELIFRAPLYIPYVQKTKTRLFVAVFGMSALFGVCHGSFDNILVQGVSGLILSAAFLKGGGAQKKFWRGLGVSVSIHFLFNSLLWLSLALTVLH